MPARVVLSGRKSLGIVILSRHNFLHQRTIAAAKGLEFSV
jgi:hypothetical protein